MEMADLDRELGFMSSQLTEGNRSDKFNEDDDIMKILSGARSQYLKGITFEEQDKMIEELTKENVQLKEENKNIEITIDELNKELLLKDESLERANKQMAEIKERLSTFEVDDLEEEINTLKQVIREKDEQISQMDLDLQYHNITALRQNLSGDGTPKIGNSSALSQKSEKTSKSKQGDFDELREELNYVINSWYESSQDLCELALTYSNELDDQAEMLNFRLQEAVASSDEGLKPNTLKDLSNLACKVLSGIIEEDNKVIQELANANDAMRLNEKSSSFKRDVDVGFESSQHSEYRCKPSIDKKATQTDLEGEEIQLIAKMLSQKETEANKNSTDLKKNKVYVKLCENKIKSLEEELKRHLRIDIDT